MDQSAGGELATKLGILRDALADHGLAAIRLRGQDWFGWATCGGSSAVLMASERGVADVLVTATDAWIVTDAIEAPRLAAEEVPPGLGVVEFPWAAPEERESWVGDAARGGIVASDLPTDVEVPLPVELLLARYRLLPSEVERYRRLGREASEAMTAALHAATSTMTELELAGEGARELLRRGIEPALILVAGEGRLPRHRHPRPTTERLGGRAMMVFCGRRAGLYANLTRFVAFGRPSHEDRRAAGAVADVEAAAWDASRPGATLASAFHAIEAAYRSAGHPDAQLLHHQGGITGYRAREVIAGPGAATLIEAGMALAWNPSLPGHKIEDTVLVTDGGIEILTLDSSWPVITVAGRTRPDILVRA